MKAILARMKSSMKMGRGGETERIICKYFAIILIDVKWRLEKVPQLVGKIFPVGRKNCRAEEGDFRSKREEKGEVKIGEGKTDVRESD